MKNRDKILDYFDNVADGTVVSANDMYEHGFERMNQEAFFRAVERLSDEGEIIRVGRGILYFSKRSLLTTKPCASAHTGIQFTLPSSFIKLLR